MSATALAGSLLLAPDALAQTSSPAAQRSTGAAPTAAECAADPTLTNCIDPGDQPADPNADPRVQAAQEAGDVVVTGSRIPRPNLDSSVPIASFTGAQIASVGQVSLGDTLNRLPALRSTLSQANSTNGIGTAGVNGIDLRGLGVTRTLVLVNGRRHVAGLPGTSTVDINTIPNDLLERVEVVTGGTSATYGSDAVSGVVNFVLKDNFEGLNANVRGGVSDRGDRGSFLASAVYGKNFADGRGNIAFSAEYARQETLLFNDRNAQTGAYTGVPGFYQTERTTFLNADGTARNEAPAGNGVPDTSYFGVNPGNTFGIISLGGTAITACPVANATNAARRAAVCTGQTSPTGGLLSNNYVFLPDGSLVRDIPAIDNRAVGGPVFGGLSATGVEGAMLLPGLERANFNAFGHFDVSPAFRPYFEAKYVHVTANQTSTQPTFINGRLSPTFFLDNPYLTAQARSTLQLVNGTTSNTAAFNFFRFNNDIGTRAEDHKRDTYRIVVGARGDVSDAGNLKYDMFFNYGRVETFYKTGGNVDVQKFNNAANAARDPVTGLPVCRINIDANPNNNDAACRPINFFGERAPLTTPDGIAYALVTSSRKQWAEQINAVGSITGDSSGLFSLPGGPVAFSIGSEYRREDVFSGYDAFTKGEYAPGQSNTFLNAIQDTNPKAINIYEAFGELRVPLLSDITLIDELTLEGSGRVSKYSFLKDEVYAYTIGGVYAPVRDLRLRVGYARSVRAPTLNDLYAGTSQTFANNFVDPCSQNVIDQEPNRRRNCAAAGIPTTITLPDGSVRPWTNAPTSGILGTNGGSPLLNPEVGKSLTYGAVFQPRFLPGFALTVDYYRITIKQAINTILPQQLVNRCYEDPVGLDNQFCSLINRRRTTPGDIADFTFTGQQGRRFAGFPDFNIGIIGNGFTNAPFNYAKLQTSGIDADLSYSHRFAEDIRLNISTKVSWLEKRNEFTFLSDPNRYARVKSLLNDPEWRGLFSANLSAGPIDFALTTQYIGKQLTGATYNTQNTEQGRPPTNADQFPRKFYPDVFIHDVQVGLRVNKQFRFYVGVDNVNDQLPPFGLTGTGAGSAIFPVTGRFFYGGARLTY